MKKRVKTAAVLLSACLCVTGVTPAFAAEDAQDSSADAAVEAVMTEDTERVEADGLNESGAITEDGPAAEAHEDGGATAIGEAVPADDVSSENIEENAEMSDENEEKDWARIEPDEDTGIDVMEASDELDVGEARTLPTTGENDKIGRYDITWESSDEAVARFTKNGEILGISSGKCVATGTVFYNGEKHVYGKHYYSVYGTAEDFTIEDMAIGVGETKNIDVYTIPTYSGMDMDSIILNSDDTSVVSIERSREREGHLVGYPRYAGVTIKGVRNGTAYIDFGAFSNGKLVHKKIKVTVGTGIAEDTIVNCGTQTVAKGDLCYLPPVTDALNEGNEYSGDTWTNWVSGNSDIAEVIKPGLIRAKKGGAVIVTCQNKEKPWVKAEYRIMVKAPVEELTLNKLSTKLFIGKSVTLVPLVMPEDANNKLVRWTSSDTKVATVTQDGKVTAKRRGTAIITCTARDRSGKSAKCKITSALPVSRISLTKTKATLAKGKKLTLKASVAPQNASDKTVRWTTSNAKVAAVSADGVVTAKGKGKATIACRANDGSGVKATCVITVN